MPVKIPYFSLKKTPPRELENFISMECWQYLKQNLRYHYFLGCTMGFLCFAICTVILFPIGAFFGGFCWGVITSRYVGTRAHMVCALANEEFFNGRRVFDWTEDGCSGILHIYTEHALGAVVLTQPVNVSGTVQSGIIHLLPIVGGYSASSVVPINSSTPQVPIASAVQVTTAASTAGLPTAQPSGAYLPGSSVNAVHLNPYMINAVAQPLEPVNVVVSRVSANQANV